MKFKNEFLHKIYNLHFLVVEFELKLNYNEASDVAMYNEASDVAMYNEASYGASDGPSIETSNEAFNGNIVIIRVMELNGAYNGVGNGYLNRTVNGASNEAIQEIPIMEPKWS